MNTTVPKGEVSEAYQCNATFILRRKQNPVRLTAVKATERRRGTHCWRAKSPLRENFSRENRRWVLEAREKMT